ncbi:nitrite reductase/ring-hydroxylating ferredoxin subunit [Pseudoduganella lurida]|uniref:Nitrite reductase/ring-hydroxylating ferredoxin subunit n=1 Tax=Pseudoduganella lurida TaxID=1036180 RepID=A0A562R824_9BURK|nr:Rieske 2Fe-2S domain-containing protein [Pseudoduganella lurida]TWI64560.1 nitrite reductase/ring-hydroxylating ferredoxin subunit [Pseudoduganella lurida]
MPEPTAMTGDRFVCAADAVADGGRGVRFDVLAGGAPATAFVIRHGGKAYAYLNRCAHVPVELDWAEGEFFESGKMYLMCATHGAVYVPSTGACAGGPCRGGRLTPVALAERDGNLYWQPDHYLRPRAD